MRLTHEEIWRAIDVLARRVGLSASALAKSAGLDATSFNPSKRLGPDGRPRWPSTESLAKVLAASGVGPAEFFALTLPAKQPLTRVTAPLLPVIGLAQAGNEGFFDDGGYAVGAAWDYVDAPLTDDPNAYALTISGDSMAPVFRHDDTILVSPAAPIRPGDRVVVRTLAGEVLAKSLLRRNGTVVSLRSFNPDHPDRQFPPDAIAWMHRIIWASQ